MPSELRELHTEPAHPLVELLAVVSLPISIGLGVRKLRRLLRRNDTNESRMRAARSLR